MAEDQGRPQSELERRRLAALDSYRVLDTAPEAAYDDVVTLAAQICGVPMALISLVDDKRQWFKAALGLDATETPREIAFCAHAIQQENLLVVNDAQRDARFANNPLVTGRPNLRFYAGAPLVTSSGEALGTLCVLDTQPRELREDQHAALQALGRLVMQQLESRKSAFLRREEEWRNQLVLDSAIDYAIITMDLQGRVTSWNEGARRILGWSAEEMRGRTCEAFFTPEDRDARVAEKEMADALSCGRGSDERWHLRKDQSRFFASGEMMALKQDDGSPVGFLKMLRDRTDARLASLMEPALLTLSDKLRDLTDASQMSRIAAELIGRTLDVSRAGYGTISEDSERILVDASWTLPGVANISGEFELRQFGSYINEVMQGRSVIIDDAAHDARADTAVMAELDIRSQINVPVVEHGKTVAIFYAHGAAAKRWHPAEADFIREVAERTRLAVQRRRAEDQVRLLAQSLHDQVEDRTRERDRLWLVSRDPFLIADSLGVWQRVNPAWTRLLGWSDRELLGRTSEWIEHEDDQAKTRQEIAKLAAGGLTTAFENRLRAKDGTFHWFSWTASEADGLLYCVARDISEDKAHAAALAESDDRLRQAQKMEAVGQLTGGLAHDFNNLLTGITGSLELLQMRVRQGRVSEIDRYVHSAQGATRRAAALTHRLLAFSRRQTLDPKPTDLNRLITDISEMIERTIGPEIEIRYATGADLWSTMIDPGQLENALLNLCINARDAMPQGGTLSIETRNETFSGKRARERDLPAGEYVFLCVSDSGTGMPQAVVARAFDPFFTTKPIGLGTGLGLSMVYGFARQSGGDAQIFSREGEGTTVCLYLHRYKGNLQEMRSADTREAEIQGGSVNKTVLVVDDDATVRMLVGEVLKELGCTVLEASDGKGGLKILDSGDSVDLLITDVGLPGGMNGRQVADAARVKRCELKVLFITGYAESAVLKHGHLETGMHLVTKPFTLEDLAARIRELVTDAV